MLEFIKMFGLGILYTILFPFIVVIFGLYLVYVFLNYLVLETMNIVGFFVGYSFTVETSLEKKMLEMKQPSENEKNDFQEIGDLNFDNFFLKEEMEGSDKHE